MDIVTSVVVYTIYVAVGVQSGKSCFDMPCDNAQSGTCFTSGCERVRSQTVCQLSSTSVQYPTSNTNETECLAPRLVPGFVKFCKNIIANAIGPEELQKEISTASTVTTPHDKPSEDEKTISMMAPGDLCYGLTMLVSVAIGSFVVGCGLTLLTLCFCKYTRHCHHKIEEKEASSNTSNIFRQRVRVRDIQGSTSSAMLLQDGQSDVTQAGLQVPSPGPFTPNDNGPMLHRKPTEPGFAFSDPIYKAASESSSRDYQSIRCDSDSPYVLNSECDSEFSTRRLADLRRELSGGSIRHDGGPNDYSSLATGHTTPRRCIVNDYACLSDDMVEDMPNWAENRFRQTTFQVNGLEFPLLTSCSRVGQSPSTSYSTPSTSLGADFPQSERPTSDALLGGTISHLASKHDSVNTTSEPHEYFVLEPM